MVLVLLAGLAFGQQDYGAGGVWNKVKGKLGTKQGIQKNADVPLKTDVPMKNIEGTRSFEVRVRCPSKREGIRITFLPLPGNDYRLVIEEDLDLDGNYEYVYDTGSQGIRVSGVCYSGVVSCDPGGTWTNCEYYYWDAGNLGYVSLVKTQDTSLLGGCFCSNSSCGVNSLVQDTVDFVAGGVAQAVMRVRENLGISRAGFDLSTMSVRLYVQDRAQCAYAETRIWGEQNPVHVYTTQTPPDGMSYVVSDPSVQSSPDSPYYLVNRASRVEIEGQSIGIPDVVSCDVRNDVSLYTTDMYENCSEIWTDPNGETWCVVHANTYDRGGWHCGGRTCRDCSPFFQGGGWEVCGTTEVCYDADGDPYPCNIQCSTDLCNSLLSLRDRGSSQWWWFSPSFRRYVFRRGNLINCYQDPDTGDYVCKYELFCRKPVEGTVVLKMNQKYGIAFLLSAIAGDRGGYWGRAVFVDGGLNDEVWTVRVFNSCAERVFFRALGVAAREGEAHTVGGLQLAHGWGENHTYPPRRGEIIILKSQAYKGDMVSLSETNTCPSDPECVIKNEWICDNRGENCIQTIRDGIKTGILPGPYCYTANTQIATYTVCAYGDRIEVRGNPGTYDRTFTGENMWFWIKREYECPPKGVDVDLSRYSAVAESTSYSPGEILYTDYYCEGGVCTPVGDYRIDAGVPDSCPAATCTVRLSGTDTSVFADRTNRAQTPGGTSTVVLEVRSCEREAGSWVCPAGREEVVVEDCRCEQGLDGVGFSTSITTLQAVVNASKDLICSTVGQ